MVTCGSRQLENHKWNYPTYVICACHSGGCALDLVECQSREQSLETDGTWLASLLVHSRSVKSFVVSQ